VVPPVGATAAVAPTAGATDPATGVVTRPVTQTTVAPATAAATAPAAAASATAKPTPPVATSSAPPAAASGDEDVGWIWPAQGSLIAGFDEAKNKGLDIAGKAGDSVLAAADGRVVYAGAGLRGYGNLIILKHNNTYLTAYAHNRTLLVKEDQSVQKGQKIAEMGNSDADRVKLHFEIRRQGKPVDPARYLPAR
jgi:lipoprotein NlpD